MPIRIYLVCLLFLAPAFAFAQDKPDGTSAKAAAVENLKKINIDKPTIVETDNFVIAGSLSEEKAKALGAVLEKVLPVARKAAKYGDKDTAWKGKLTVYFLPEGGEYKSFMRRVLQTMPEGMYADVRSETPLLVDPMDLPGKPSDSEQYANTAARVAGELLKAKGTGTQAVPDWLRDGFGRVAVMRAEGTNSKRYLAYRTQAKNAVPKKSIADVTGGEKSAASEVLANSLAEFVAFNPKYDFGKFLDALRPSDENQTPSAMSGFMALGWKEEAMADAAWKQWVRTGK